jgi:hypothetical protein
MKLGILDGEVVGLGADGDTYVMKDAKMNIDPKFEIDPKDHGKSYPDDNPKTMHGIQKPSMFNVPTTALLHLMGAMANGAKKYGPYNWRSKNVSASIYYDAAMRHLMAWIDGEDIAEDSGVHHLGHVMACCAIILDAETQKTLNDNRPVRGKFSSLVKEMTLEKPNVHVETIERKYNKIKDHVTNSLFSVKICLKELSYGHCALDIRLKEFHKLKEEVKTLIEYINKALEKTPALGSGSLLSFLHDNKKKAESLLNEIDTTTSVFTQFDEFGLPLNHPL